MCHPLALDTLAMSTLTPVTFSSITCFSVRNARTSASSIDISSLYASCNAVCAPSLPLPIAFALYCTNVPEGSV